MPDLPDAQQREYAAAVATNEMAVAGDIDDDLAYAVNRTRSAGWASDMSTAELHEWWQTGRTADYVEEELRRRHPELQVAYLMYEAARRLEEEHWQPLPESPFDAMDLAKIPLPPVASGLWRSYSQLLTRVTSYEDAYLDGPALARRLGVEPGTVRKMAARRVLPRPDLTVAGRPAWHWQTVYDIELHRRGPGRPQTA